MRITRFLATAALTTLVPGTALATNGYFSHGYGTKNAGMAGAGTALSQDSIAAATNPAGMAFVGSRVDGGLEVFSISRQVKYRARMRPSLSLISATTGPWATATALACRYLPTVV
ncbi:MAG TPA: hypothetical protein VK006_11435 [Marinobacter sp.]|nr:hypothetical protein [Marinobacter sp.]